MSCKHYWLVEQNGKSKTCKKCGKVTTIPPFDNLRQVALPGQKGRDYYFEYKQRLDNLTKPLR